MVRGYRILGENQQEPKTSRSLLNGEILQELLKGERWLFTFKW